MQRRDGLIAAGLATAGQIEVWAFWVPDDQGPKLLAAVMMLAMAAPLAYRRRAPLAVPAASCAVFVAWTLITPRRAL